MDAFIPSFYSSIHCKWKLPHISFIMGKTGFVSSVIYFYNLLISELHYNFSNKIGNSKPMIKYGYSAFRIIIKAKNKIQINCKMTG